MRFLLARSALLVGLALGASNAPTWAQDAEKSDKPTAGAEEKVTTTYDKVVVERETRIVEVETKIPHKVKPTYVAAIFVKNRSPKVPDEKVLVVQDFINAHLNGKGFRIIAREDAINKVADFASKGPNRGEKGAPGDNLDQLLSNNTSALRLADNLAADYILNVAVTQYGSDKMHYKSGDIDHTTIVYKLKLTYTLLDTTVGGALTSGVATATFTDRVQPGLEIERENTLDDLLDGASADLTAMMEAAAKGGSIPGPETQAQAKKEVNFFVNCAVADLMIPEVVRNDKGQWVVQAGRHSVEPLAFVVELDGTAIGSTNVQKDEAGNIVGMPRFTAKPGLHKLRLRRELFKDWEGTVNVKEGLTLTVAMVMTDKALDRFMSMGREFNSWKVDQILSEAQGKAWEAMLKLMAEDHLRAHVRDNDKNEIKINVNAAAGASGAAESGSSSSSNAKSGSDPAKPDAKPEAPKPEPKPEAPKPEPASQP